MYLEVAVDQVVGVIFLSKGMLRQMTYKKLCDSSAFCIIFTQMLRRHIYYNERVLRKGELPVLQQNHKPLVDKLIFHVGVQN